MSRIFIKVLRIPRQIPKSEMTSSLFMLLTMLLVLKMITQKIKWQIRNLLLKERSEPVITPIVLKITEFEHKALLDEWESSRKFSEKHPIQCIEQRCKCVRSASNGSNGPDRWKLRLVLIKS